MRELYDIKSEKLKKHLQKVSVNGIVYITSKDFLDVLNIKGNNTYYINDLLEQGFLIKLHDGWRKGSEWYPGKYMINPKYKAKIISSNNLFYESFNAENVLFLKENGQIFICIDSIPNAVKMHTRSIYYAIRNNPDLIHCRTYNRMYFINKEEFLVLLMKLNYPSLNKERRKKLIEFQKWAMKVYEEKYALLQEQVNYLLNENLQIKKQYYEIKNHIEKINKLASSY